MSGMIAPVVARRSSIVRIGLPVLAVTMVASSCSQPNLRGALIEAGRYMTESADLERYFAYSNAALGRSYQGFYVRSVEEWRRTFEGDAAQRPADRPIVTPPRPLIPYRDFLVEYPPGFFLVTVPPALLTTTPRGFAVVFGAFMLLLLWVAALLCERLAVLAGSRISQARLIRWILIAAVSLGTLVTQRYDAVVAFLLCAMCWATLAAGRSCSASPRARPLRSRSCGARGRHVWSVPVARTSPRRMVAGARGRGSGRAGDQRADPVPGAVRVHGHAALPHRPSARDRQHRGRTARVVALGRSFGGRRQPRFRFRQRGRTAFRLGVDGDEHRRRYRHRRGVCAAWRHFGSCPTTEIGARQLLAATAAVIAVFFATGKVGSPQYLTWLLPLGVLVALLDGRWLPLAALLTTLLIAQTVYTIVPYQVEAFRPWASALVVARNTVLIRWAWSIASGAGC